MLLAADAPRRIEGVSDEPDLYVFDFSDDPRARELREARERARAESRRRYREHLATILDLHGVAGDVDGIAEVALDALTRWIDLESEDECRCGCHPRLPDSDHHDFGFGCVCRKTRADRTAAWDSWREEMDAYWASPEGRALTTARDAEEAELQSWLESQPGVTVTSHGGYAPEQWEGAVDGHSFSFRERHDDWHIELDLRANGRTANAVRGTDDAGEFILEPVELEEGDVIAEGSTRVAGYGRTPKERAVFIVNQIQTHLGQASCGVHTRDLTAVVAMIGAGVAWCPACRAQIDRGRDL